MTMYFDFRVNTKSKTLINCIEWHQQLSLLAVGLCTRSPLHSFITVFDQLVTYPKIFSKFLTSFSSVSAICTFFFFFLGRIFTRCKWVPARKQRSRMCLMAPIKENSSGWIFFWWYLLVEWSAGFLKLIIPTFCTRYIFKMVWTWNKISFNRQSKFFSIFISF